MSSQTFFFFFYMEITYKKSISKAKNARKICLNTESLDYTDILKNKQKKVRTDTPYIIAKLEF